MARISPDASVLGAPHVLRRVLYALVLRMIQTFHCIFYRPVPLSGVLVLFILLSFAPVRAEALLVTCDFYSLRMPETNELIARSDTGAMFLLHLRPASIAGRCTGYECLPSKETAITLTVRPMIFVSDVQGIVGEYVRTNQVQTIQRDLLSALWFTRKQALLSNGLAAYTTAPLLFECPGYTMPGLPDTLWMRQQVTLRETPEMLPAATFGRPVFTAIFYSSYASQLDAEGLRTLPTIWSNLWRIEKK